VFRVCDVVVSTECGYYYCVEGSQQQQARRPVDQTASNDQENRTVISQFYVFMPSQHSLEKGHYAFTLSVPLSVPCQHGEPRRQPR